jgi:alpha-beta hydrolase superfamily lysophospholipase
MKCGKTGETNAATPNTTAKAPQGAASRQVREMAEGIVVSPNLRRHRWSTRTGIARAFRLQSALSAESNEVRFAKCRIPEIPGPVVWVDPGLDRAALMGYSMGGKIAINPLARFPDRFTCVVVGGAGLPPSVSDAPMRAVIAAALETDDVSTITDSTALFYRNLAESRVHDPRSIAGLDNDLKALGACYGRYFRELNEVDENALRRVQVPVLVVIGDRDEDLPLAQRLVEVTPGAQLVVLPGEDHISAIPTQAYKDAVAAFLRTRRSVSVA